MRLMVGDESLLCGTRTRFNEREQEAEHMTLDKLVALTDEKGLVSLGLALMEALARAEGRTLWH
jgi:hypothetical protein